MVDAIAFADAVKKNAPTQLLGCEGWYKFVVGGQTLDACLRPGGVLFCPSHQEQARWCIQPGTKKVALNWGKYGCYDLEQKSESPLSFAGNHVTNAGQTGAMEKVAELSPAEVKLLGNGGVGTEWSFIWSGGQFPVEFRGDGYNHFVCKQYPAHAHWTIGGENREEITIHWANYGTYKLKVDGPAGAGEGSYINKPEDWRKMTYIRDLDSATAAQQCDLH